MDSKNDSTNNYEGIVLDSKIELSPYNLLDIEPVNELDLVSSGWSEDGCFSNGVLRGPKSELERFIEEYHYRSGQISPTGIYGIYQLNVKDAFNYGDGELYLSKVIHDYPALKVVAFLESMDPPIVWTAYSESGYSYITEIKEVGEYDAASEYPWQWEYSPIDTFNDQWNDIQTGEIGEINYKCPFTKKWEDNHYVVAKNGNHFLLSNVGQLKSGQ